MGFCGVTSMDVIGSVEVYGSVEVGTVLVTGNFYPGSQKVYGDVEVGTVPVIGAFYPGSQKIYGDVEVGTVPVIGAFYPGSQKIYGDVEVGTVPVIGAFYPGSQKIYGDVEVGTVPVTGDFYPATQPASGSVGIKSGSVGILDGAVKITDGTYTATITAEGYQDVKSHSSDKCFAGDYSTDQTGTVIITPPTGKKIKIVQIFVSTENRGKNIELRFGVGGPDFFKLYTDKTQTHTGNIVCAVGSVDTTVNLSCGANTFISIAYDEVS